MKRSAQAFAAYEYKVATVDRRRASEYPDGYESFGWELDDTYESLAGIPGAGSRPQKRENTCDYGHPGKNHL